MYSAFEKRLNLSLCHLNDRRPAMRTGERIFRRRKIPQQLIDFRSVKTVVCLYRRFAGSHNDFFRRAPVTERTPVHRDCQRNR